MRGTEHQQLVFIANDNPSIEEFILTNSEEIVPVSRGTLQVYQRLFLKLAANSF